MGKDRVCVGAVAGAFGVNGEVRLKSFCTEPEDIAGYGALFTDDGTRSFTVKVTRRISGGLAARLSGVETREAAEGLRGVRLHADRANLPALPDDEFYHADLIGIEVRDTGGATLGRVSAVLNHGAGDLLEIQRPGASSVLLPFTRQAVPTVDIVAGRIIADPPEGIFE